MRHFYAQGSRETIRIIYMNISYHHHQNGQHSPMLENIKYFESNDSSTNCEPANEKLVTAPSSPVDQAASFYYDGNRYYLDTLSEYVPLDKASVKCHLKKMALPADGIETAICRIQTERFIHYAGPLAGHRRGLHAAGDKKLLATVSPKIIQPSVGSWPTLIAILKAILEDPDFDQVQLNTFLAWLKVAREAMISNHRRPGQVLAFAGPRNCGKSLLIEIVEACLGGRRANPYPHFSGRTHFNADLAGAELLVVDDEAGSNDMRSRRNLAAAIKSSLFSGTARIEGKGKTAFIFRPCWRMVMALNDEPESLLVLPLMTEDIGDKVILFKCHRRPLPMLTHTLEERTALSSKILEEIPAMVAFLDTWSIPEELREERCGVTAFHHPTILSALHELSPEAQSMGLIDRAHAAGYLSLPWTGTSAQLKSLLCGAPELARVAEKIWYSPNILGTHLGRLDGKGRVERLPLKDGFARWRILESGEVEQVE